jgi:2-polyprenyl-3-methyl-5-hydroxy-6-metoxy-1,4-benzoquinol methylase
VDPEIVEHYASGVEIDRLTAGERSRIEFVRTKELLERFLPAPPARVLDVGGGPGLYAEWLAARGYDVTLVDPVPLHIEEASARAARSGHPFAVRLGDARRLSDADGSADALLLSARSTT